MKLKEKNEQVERVTQLIRLKATGTPDELAEKLKVCKRTLHNILATFKKEGIEVYYCSNRRSYCFKQNVYYYFGFSVDKVQLKGIAGGRQYFFEDFLESAKILHWEGVDLH